jgi:hypothetical protein
MTVPGPGPVPPQGRRAGYVQRGKDRTASRARNVIEPHLEPGEQPLAGTRLHTGPSDWWRLVPRVGELVRFFQRHYFVVHTDRRLIFCRLSYWTARPKNVKMTLANEHVQISSYRPGKLHPSLKLSHPDRKRPMTLRGNRVWRPEVEQLLAGLGYGANGQPVPAPAYQQPGALPYQAPQGYQGPQS